VTRYLRGTALETAGTDHFGADPWTAASFALAAILPSKVQTRTPADVPARRGFPRSRFKEASQ
jgi:hypothetical protein